MFGDRNQYEREASRRTFLFLDPFNQNTTALLYIQNISNTIASCRDGRVVKAFGLSSNQRSTRGFEPRLDPTFLFLFKSV